MNKASQAKIQEAKFAIDRLNEQVRGLMRTTTISPEAMVIALVTNAAYLFVQASFQKFEKEALRLHAFKQVIEIFIRARRTAERELLQTMGIDPNRVK